MYMNVHDRGVPRRMRRRVWPLKAFFGTLCRRSPIGAGSRSRALSLVRVKRLAAHLVVVVVVAVVDTVDTVLWLTTINRCKEQRAASVGGFTGAAALGGCVLDASVKGAPL